MSNHSANNKRIAKNTMVLYVRMFVMMFIGFFTARITLNALGVDDYGINNVVGGLVSMFSLLSSSLTSASSRFITFALGKGDFDEQKRTFSTTVNIHIILAVVVVLAIETVGVWFLNHKLNIPPDRMVAAHWVLQCSVVSFALGLLSVPYNSSIIAHERMSTFAYLTIFDAVCKLIVVGSIYYYGGDKLILFSVLSLLPLVIRQGIYVWYCKHNFEECVYEYRWDKKIFREMFAFSTWNFIGCTAGLMRDQGVNIVINMFTSPAVNAARGIAMHLNGLIGQFTGNFMVSLNPQITKYYAVGDLTHMHKLIYYGTRFSYYLFMFISIPVIFEIEPILTVWLGEVPAHTVLFTRLVLVLSLIDIFSQTLITAQNATGNIRNYQLVVGGLYLLNLPFSYLLLKMGMIPEITLVVAIVIAIACMITRLCFLRYSIKLRVFDYVLKVVLNGLLVTALSLIAPWFCYHHITSPLWQFFAVCGASVVSSALAIYYIGCCSSERNMINSYVVKFYHKLLRR